jgi:hypothetical protein
VELSCDNGGRPATFSGAGELAIEIAPQWRATTKSALTLLADSVPDLRAHLAFGRSFQGRFGEGIRAGSHPPGSLLRRDNHLLVPVHALGIDLLLLRIAPTSGSALSVWRAAVHRQGEPTLPPLG